MIQKIELFFFVISVLFSGTFLVRFLAELFKENPIPIKVSKTNQIFLYLSVSYIITAIILVLFT